MTVYGPAGRATTAATLRSESSSARALAAPEATLRVGVYLLHTFMFRVCPTTPHAPHFGGDLGTCCTEHSAHRASRKRRSTACWQLPEPQPHRVYSSLPTRGQGLLYLLEFPFWLRASALYMKSSPLSAVRLEWFGSS
jgi:hypothetical protein